MEGLLSMEKLQAKYSEDKYFISHPFLSYNTYSSFFLAYLE